MKKIITMLTAILLLFSFSVCYAAEINFTDVKSDDWFYKNLQELTEKNIASGYPDGTFKPNNTLKLEEFIKMLVVATEEEPVEQKEGQEWWQIYIENAEMNKYINEQQKLLIGQNIDRQTMTEILYNTLTEKEELMAYTEAELEFLSDRLTDVSKSDVKTLTVNGVGIISGYPDGTFKPEGTLTRAEAVAVISRAINPELRNPVEIALPDTRTLDELPPVDLSHLYDYPTLLGRTVEEDNEELLTPMDINGVQLRTFDPGEVVKDVKEFFKLFHSRDFRTIENIKQQYIKDVNYYLGGMKEYKCIEYNDGLKAYYTNFDEKDSQSYREYVLSLDTYIEDFFDEWIEDTVNSKVQVQAEFYTEEDLLILANGNKASRGVLRIKYDSHLNPENIKYELDFVKSDKMKYDEERHISENQASKSSYNVYKDFEKLPQLEVGKWYEIDIDVVMPHYLVNPNLYAEDGEKSTLSYGYVYVIDLREIE
jgi:hypothetical protein